MRTVRLLTVIQRQARAGSWAAALQYLETSTTLFRSETGRKEKTLLQVVGGNVSTAPGWQLCAVNVRMS